MAGLGGATKANMNRKERIGVVVSAVWIIVVFAFAASAARVEHYFSRERVMLLFFDFGEFFFNFLLYGILPILIAWGIYWIKNA